MFGKMKGRIKGVTYLLSHPRQVLHLIIRETRYRQRKQSKLRWLEWQKYDAHMHICKMRANPEALRAEGSLNVARIEIISEMVSQLGNSLIVLDAGCGDGVVSEPIRKMGNYVISMELPQIASLAHKCRVPLVIAGDAEHLTFASDTFDLVLASEVVEHLWHPHNFFDEVHRVLRANGYLIISTPEGREGLSYDSHKHYFTVEGLKMFDARFSVCQVKRLKPTGTSIPTIILLLRKAS